MSQTTVQLPSGLYVYADLISSAYFPMQKITLGASNADDGPVSATNPMPVKGLGYSSLASFTRPANGNTYAVGDVVGASSAVLTFANAGPSAGHVVLTSAAVRLDMATLTSGISTFRLHLYSSSPGSAYADEATWNLPSGDRSAYLGYIDLGTIVDMGDTLYSQVDGLNKHVKLASASTSLYGYLVTPTSFVATTGMVGNVTLNAIAV